MSRRSTVDSGAADLFPPNIRASLSIGRRPRAVSVQSAGRRSARPASKMLEFVAKVNPQQQQLTGDPEIQTSLAQQEMAFRMQTSVPELMDLSGETKAVTDLYGPEVQKTGSFARNCLLARRMAERECAVHSTVSSRLGSPLRPAHPSAEARPATSINRLLAC